MAGLTMTRTGTGTHSSRPRKPTLGAASLRQRLFGTPLKVLITVLVAALLAYPVSGAVRWALIDSVFMANSPDVCKAAAGACWATIYHHARVVFFGLYPREEQWRPMLALAGLLGVVVMMVTASMRSPLLLAALLAAAWAGFLLLLQGGILGLTPIRPEQFGGLPLSIHVFLGTVAIGFPLAIALALGRQSRLHVISWFCTTVIETVRSVPLLTILFCAAVVVPIMLTGALTPTKINRIIAAMALFYACYQAEVIRGGMRAVPEVEIEGARALGLKDLQTTFLIVLPQAIRVTIPASINLLVVALKDTSLVVVVGLFDFVASANTAIASDAWAPFFKEVYIVVALTFLALAGGISAFGRIAERKYAPIRS